jgi:hypothetical protein
MRAFQKLARIIGLTALGVAALSSAAGALPMILDYTGFTWNQTVGTSLTFNSVGVVDGMTSGIGDPSQVYTYCLSGLTLSRVQNLGNGMILRSYAGGDFRVFESTSALDRGYTYGVNPPNPLAPASFTDGNFWLGGNMSGFSLLVDTQHGLGSFSANGVYYGGAFYSKLQNNHLFTFSGLTKAGSAGVPRGYEYRTDGQLDADVAPVPEPGTIVMLGSGLLGLGFVRRRRPR